MATRRLAMGKGLAQNVAMAWRRSVSWSILDVENDTAMNRLVRAELERENWAPSTPESVDSWDEALSYRTRDEALAEETSRTAPVTPM